MIVIVIVIVRLTVAFFAPLAIGEASLRDFKYFVTAVSKLERGGLVG